MNHFRSMIQKNAWAILIALVVVLYVVVIGKGFYDNSIVPARHEAKLIAECQSKLPRNQKCIIVKTAVVKK